MQTAPDEAEVDPLGKREVLVISEAGFVDTVDTRELITKGEGTTGNGMSMLVEG